MNIEEQITKYLLEKPNVFINYNDETGIWQYSVQVVGTDFWLDSFPTKEEAYYYCNIFDLRVIT